MAKKKDNSATIGKWAFIIGIIIAVIAGFITGYAEIVLLVLFILGLIVGFLNIVKEDVMKFLLAVTALLVMGVAVLNALNVIDMINDYLKAILSNFITFISAAGFIVAIKAVLETGKK
jgi:hypothetical protein